VSDQFLKKKSASIAVCMVVMAVAGASTVTARAEDHEEREFKNTVELFLGAVSETDPTETGAALGIEYNRRLSRLWSIGIEGAEFSTTDTRRDWVLLVPVYLHPAGGLSLKVAPGVEHGTVVRDEGGEPEDEGREFLFRIGVGWEFEIGRRWSATPEVNLDFVDGRRTWVYGVSLGVRF